MEEEKINYKEHLQEIWNLIFIEYRQLKFKLTDEYFSSLRISKGKMMDEYYDLEGSKVYLEISKDIKTRMVELDNNFKQGIKNKYVNNFLVDWLVDKFTTSVIDTTNIHFKRKQKNDMNLDKEKELKNNRICYLLQELKEGNKDNIDYDNPESNFKIEYNKDKKDYIILDDICMFSDTLEPVNLENKTLYHGTTLVNAKNILGMNKLRGGINIFFNAGKIFFTDELTESIKYAKRFNWEQYHIIFELDLSKHNLYKREHYLLEREGYLYFIDQPEIPIKEIIKKIYLIEGNDIKEISIEEMMNIKVEGEEKLKEVLNIFFDTKKEMYDRSKYLRESLLQIKDNEKMLEAISKVNNMSKTRLTNIVNIVDSLVFKEKNIENFKFKNIFEHEEFLKENEVINENIIFETDIHKNKYLYHGTAISSGKNITNEEFKPFLKNEHEEDYNKVFFTDDLNYAKLYGKLGGAKTDNSVENKRYVVFECNLEDYDIFGFKVTDYKTNRLEYVSWGSMDSSVIKHIYLCTNNEIIREISREELLSMEC